MSSHRCFIHMSSDVLKQIISYLIPCSSPCRDPDSSSHPDPSLLLLLSTCHTLLFHPMILNILPRYLEYALGSDVINARMCIEFQAYHQKQQQKPDECDNSQESQDGDEKEEGEPGHDNNNVTSDSDDMKVDTACKIKLILSSHPIILLRYLSATMYTHQHLVYEIKHSVDQLGPHNHNNNMNHNNNNNHDHNQNNSNLSESESSSSSHPHTSLLRYLDALCSGWGSDWREMDMKHPYYILFCSCARFGWMSLFTLLFERSYQISLNRSKSSISRYDDAFMMNNIYQDSEYTIISRCYNHQRPYPKYLMHPPIHILTLCTLLSSDPHISMLSCLLPHLHHNIFPIISKWIISNKHMFIHQHQRLGIHVINMN